MKSRFERLRPTPAIVVSGIALFFAIGGIGYAAGQIGTDDIQSDAVTKAKIAESAVNSAKIQDGTIKYKDLKFSPDSLVGPEGPQGPQGEQGPAGPVNADVDLQAEIANTQASPSLDNGGIKALAVNEGFAWALLCKSGAGPGTGSMLVVQNVSGGDNSHISGALTFLDSAAAPIATDQSDDFDIGEAAIVADAFNGNTASRSGTPAAPGNFPGALVNGNRGESVLIYGTNGTTQMGFGGALLGPTSYPGGPACVGSVNILAK